MSQHARRRGRPPSTRSGTVAASLSGTPGLLRALIVLAIIVSVTAAVVVSGVAKSQDTALGTARDEAVRLGDIQSTSTALASADAYATNAFLVGGLEGSATRDQYVSEITYASSMIPSLAHSGTTTDAAYLSDINADVTTYSTLIAQARANNRQGLAVGAAYLDDASVLLREEVRPDLATLITRGDYRVRSAIEGLGVAAGFAVPLVLVLAVFLGIQVWLTHRSHRFLNPGLVVATITVMLCGTVSITLLEDARMTAIDAQDGPYSVATLMSGAQAAANDAKSHESLGLVQRGSGDEREVEVNRALQRAYSHIHSANQRGGVGATARATLDTWNQRHNDIRTLDAAGDWDGAVAKATALGPNSSNTAFAQFRSAAEAEVTTATVQATEKFDAARSQTALAALIGVGGLVGAAVFAWWGLTRRLEEYR